MNKQKHILNTSGYIPEVFQGVDPKLKIDLEIVNPLNPSWTEIVAHLAQFNQYSIEQSKQEIKELLVLGLTENKSSIYAGLAKCYIAEGHLIDAIKTLGKSYSLLNNNMEEKSFLLLEMVNLMTLIGNYDQSMLLLNDINQIKKSTYLKNLSQYYAIVTQVRKGNINVFDQLVDSSHNFKNNIQTATLASHYKIMGNLQGKLKKFELAEEYYIKALDVCGESHTHLIDAIHHDYGMLKFRTGHIEEGIDRLEKIFSKAISHYTKAYTIGNIGFIYFHQKQYNVAKDYFKKSLVIAQDEGVFHLIPGICYYLGKCNSGNKSAEYYKKGSEVALELARYNFPLKGEKLLVLEEYMKSNENSSHKTNDKFDFSFAIDKSLKEIKSTFQYLTLKELLKKTGSVANTVKHLNISPSTYSKIMNKIENESSLSNYDGFIQFINSNQQKPWKDLNSEFEKTLFEFLYLEYGLNKRVMSKKLDVNYTRFVTKMNKIVKINKLEKN
jgi:tetratricopeptide (TPR) repeat protein